MGDVPVFVLRTVRMCGPTGIFNYAKTRKPSALPAYHRILSLQMASSGETRSISGSIAGGMVFNGTG